MFRACPLLKSHSFLRLSVALLAIAGIGAPSIALAIEKTKKENCPALLAETAEKRLSDAYLKILLRYRDLIADDEKYARALKDLIRTGEYAKLPEVRVLGSEGERLLDGIARVRSPELDSRIRKEIGDELADLGKTAIRVNESVAGSERIRQLVKPIDVAPRYGELIGPSFSGNRAVWQVNGNGGVVADLWSGKITGHFRLPVEIPIAKILSPDGSKLLLSGEDGSIALVDVAGPYLIWKSKVARSWVDRTAVKLRIKPAESVAVEDFRTNPDFSYAFARTSNGEIHRIDLATGETIAKWKGPRKGADLAHFESADGETALVRETEDSAWKVIRMDRSQRKLVAVTLEKSEAQSEIHFAKDGSRAWSTVEPEDRFIFRKWNLSTGELETETGLPFALAWVSSDLKRAVLSPNVRFVGEKGVIRFYADVVYWDLETSKEIERIILDSVQQFDSKNLYVSEDEKTFALFTSQNALSTRPSFLVLWKPTTGLDLNRILFNRPDVNDVLFDFEGEIAVVDQGSKREKNHEAVLFDLKAGKSLKIFTDVRETRFSEGERRALIQSSEGTTLIDLRAPDRRIGGNP